MKNDEELIHRAIWQHIQIRGDKRVIAYHCPNGEARSKATGSRLKAMGVVAGVPDLCFILTDGRPAFLELKRIGGKMSPAQIDFAARCDVLGVEIATAYTIDQALSILAAWGVLKET